MRNVRRWDLSRVISILAVLTLAWTVMDCRAEDGEGVKVEKVAPAIQRRVFNPWNPFEARPKLGPGQKAYTDYNFNLVAGLDDFDVVDQEERHGRWFVRVRPKGVRAKLSLPIVIWTPQGAPKKCLAHEEGHRKIAERIYEFAGDIVAHYAAQTQANTYYGEGASVELAVKDGYKSAVTELNQSYRETVFDYCKLVTEEYDRITNHGLNPIGEDDAIQQSFEKCSTVMARLLEKREKAQQPRPQVQGPITNLDAKKDETGEPGSTP